MYGNTTFNQLYTWAKQNRWVRFFTVFNRVALAAGFLSSGFIKIAGERFTALSVNHPMMGNYLEALYYTGYYYTFIGVVQMTAAVLLLIPRTATLGALLYFPVIVNIGVLSFAVRFDGSLLTSPLMVLANLYLLCWDYDKLKAILPIKHTQTPADTSGKKGLDNTFPVGFFGGVFIAVCAVVFTVPNLYELMPKNTMRDCRDQCPDSGNQVACEEFCACIHTQGQPLDKCLEAYETRKAAAAPLRR